MGDVPSEGIALCLAPQPVLGTDPTAEWTKLLIDKGSLQKWKRSNQTVEKNVHSPYMVARKGSVVGFGVNPAFRHDCNKDFMELVAEPTMRCNAKHPGGKGQRRYRVQAVVDGGVGVDSLTVAALGDLAAGTLMKIRGSAYPQNNAVFKTAAGSIAGSIKFPTGSLVAEAAPAKNMTADVIGFEGADSDIEFDASGNLTSTVENFVNRGIVAGMLLAIGGDSVGTRFANFNAYNGWAWVKSVSANLVELEDWTWTPGAADDGAGKTIRIYTCSLYRNYSILDPLYARKLLCGDLEEPLAGADDTSRFTACRGLAVKTLEFNAPLKNKITATLTLVGTDATKPVDAAHRLGGAGAVAGDSPAKAYEPLAVELVDTASDEEFVRVMDSTGNKFTQINSWTLTLENNVSAKEVQGTEGAIGHHFGEFNPMLKTEAYYRDSDQTAAAAENRDMHADACFNNGEFAWAWRLPRIALRDDEKQYDANTQVKMTFDGPGFGHETTNVAAALCIFGFVPDRSAFE
jgi:hypothetical protein